jgi:hypothetical protein
MCLYNPYSLSSHPWLSKRTSPKILELCRINYFDMFILGHPFVKIEGNDKWRMDGSKNGNGNYCFILLIPLKVCRKE